MSYLKHTLRAQLFISAVIACANVQAQAPARSSKAESAFASLRFSDAVRYFKDEYRDAKGSDKQAVVASRIADCYWLMRNYDSAYHWYGTIPAQPLQSNVTAKVRMADLLAIRGDYAQAAKILEGLSGYAQKAEGFKNVGALKVDAADLNIQYLESVNTQQFREFSPVLTGAGLIWSTNLPVKGGSKGVMGWDNQRYTGLMVASDRSALSASSVPANGANSISKSSTESVKRLAENYDLADFERSRRVVVPADLKDQVAKILKVANPVNIVGGLSFNQAHAGYHSSGQLYFSANRQEKLKNKTRTVGIASSAFQNAVANDVKFIFADGGSHSLMHPAIHADGATLVFASDKPGGSGGFDLYVTTRSTDGVWSDPKALTGANTAGNELFPTFGLNGKLYFSSDGRQGLGCLDIYSAEFSSSAVKNIAHLSYPVNSAYDDFGMTVSQDGKLGYFSSDRLGSDDIFKFTFEEKKVKISGIVKSEQSSTGKPGVEVVLEKKTLSGQYAQASVTKTDAKGSYEFQVRPGNDYRISIIDAGQKRSQDIKTDKVMNGQAKAVDMMIHDAPAPTTVSTTVEKPVEVSKPNKFTVNFDFDASTVKSSDHEVLSKVKSAMDANESLVCNLSGHADASGSSSYNMQLSAKRAAAVKSYLLSQGLKASRIRTVHFGSTKLILLTDDRVAAEVNRRVEVELIEKN